MSWRRWAAAAWIPAAVVVLSGGAFLALSSTGHAVDDAGGLDRLHAARDTLAELRHDLRFLRMDWEARQRAVAPEPLPGLDAADAEGGSSAVLPRMDRVDRMKSRLAHMQERLDAMNDFLRYGDWSEQVAAAGKDDGDVAGKIVLTRRIRALGALSPGVFQVFSDDGSFASFHFKDTTGAGTMDGSLLWTLLRQSRSAEGEQVTFRLSSPQAWIELSGEGSSDSSQESNASAEEGRE